MVHWVVTIFVYQTLAKLLLLNLSPHLPLSSAVIIYTQHELFSVCLLGSVDPGQTDHRGAV